MFHSISPKNWLIPNNKLFRYSGNLHMQHTVTYSRFSIGTHKFITPTYIYRFVISRLAAVGYCGGTAGALGSTIASEFGSPLIPVISDWRSDQMRWGSRSGSPVVRSTTRNYKTSQGPHLECLSRPRPPRIH